MMTRNGFVWISSFFFLYTIFTGALLHQEGEHQIQKVGSAKYLTLGYVLYRSKYIGIYFIG